MAVGVEIISAYAGVANFNSFEDINKTSKTKIEKIIYSEKERELYKLYGKVRSFKENGMVSEYEIQEIFHKFKTLHRNDWLLPLELYELVVENNFKVQEIIVNHLNALKNNKEVAKLIENGLILLSQETAH